MADYDYGQTYKDLHVTAIRNFQMVFYCPVCRSECFAESAADLLVNCSSEACDCEFAKSDRIYITAEILFKVV